MPKKSGKNRFSDADRLKPILYSCSSYISKKHLIEEEKKNTICFYVAMFNGPLPKLHFGIPGAG